jgi:hypothetical protein
VYFTQSNILYTSATENMGIPNTRMMLAFLLAISDLQEDLTADEKATLGDIGDLLVTPSHPLIKETLIAMIQKNDSLNQRYQEFIVQIDNIDDKSLQKFLTELKSQLPESRGHFQGNPDLESSEFMNVTVLAIIRQQDSVTAIKQSGLVDKFMNFINNLTK